jgi:opacity protein-like surface antigen
VRFRKLVLIAGLAAAFAASAATAATMHPVLAAHLSGMGEHGIVNLQVKSKSNQVCWSFDLPTTKNVTATSIHTGTSKVVVLKLGKTYTAKGCAKADPMVVEHLETKPATYWVFVDTKGHPGELRGKLFAGMAHM